MSIDATGTVAGAELQQQRNKELKKACQEFESVFTYELLKSMRKTVDKCDLFHGGEGEEIYESMLDQELSKSMSGYGGNSLSELLYQQLSRIDSGAQTGQAADVETDSSSPAGGIISAQTRSYSPPARSISRESVAVLSTGDARVDSGSDGASTADSQPEWPLQSVISSKFGMRKDPFTSTNRFHSGIDIAAAEGTEVKAAMSGEVTMSRNMEGYGNVVAVDHGQGLVTIYAHNEKNLVKVGDKVEKGSTIAKVGSTGRSTGPHLHFEVRKDGIKINPADYLGIA